ncbi:riboflavin synthase [Specibacter sp. NPDC057265]|uniref:riboflavin synthase n=1 Tax=Specibacter sp. NPDC057265 TaxID=3346075 RepID=UPI003633E733
MFTGIIAGRGTVIELLRSADDDSAALVLAAGAAVADLEAGGSLAVDGVCLTATRIHNGTVDMDVMGETLVRTTVGLLQAGDTVNLERCVPVAGRLDGHVVQGHVDGTGTLVERENQGSWERLRFTVPRALARYIAEKGSIAIDGVSLTVTAVSAATEADQWFEVGLIPVTLAATGLGAKHAGAAVNLEVDVLAKYAQRLLEFAGEPAESVRPATIEGGL